MGGDLSNWPAKNSNDSNYTINSRAIITQSPNQRTALQR